MVGLSETQRRFVELDKKRAEYKKFMEDYNQSIQDLLKEIGLNAHFQDDEGTVYQTAQCDGKWVHFDKFEVNRTRRAGERAGSLSLTKAKELGYDVN